MKQFAFGARAAFRHAVSYTAGRAAFGSLESRGKRKEMIVKLRNLKVLLLLGFGALLYGQDRGTITGQVLDSSGAIVPTAKVTLANPATGQKTTVETNADGAYTFLSLTAGRYQVVAEKEGFRRAEAPNVVVQVNTTSRLDIHMQVGAVRYSSSCTRHSVSECCSSPECKLLH